MLTVSLLRHAKSDWPTGAAAFTTQDHDRVLAKRGIRAAKAMGRYLADHDLEPDLVVCSSAARTRQTHELVFSAAGMDPPTVVSRAIYHAMSEELLDTLRHSDTALAVEAVPSVLGTVSHVMLIGHNPGLQDLAIELLSRGEPALMADIKMKYPTAALTQISCDIENWAELRMLSGRLVRFIKPRSLTDR